MKIAKSRLKSPMRNSITGVRISSQKKLPEINFYLGKRSSADMFTLLLKDASAVLILIKMATNILYNLRRKIGGSLTCTVSPTIYHHWSILMQLLILRFWWWKKNHILNFRMSRKSGVYFLWGCFKKDKGHLKTEYYLIWIHLLKKDILFLWKTLLLSPHKYRNICSLLISELPLNP